MANEFYVDNFNELNATIVTYNSFALKLESNTETNILQHCRNFKLRQCCTEIPRHKMDFWVGKLLEVKLLQISFKTKE